MRPELPHYGWQIDAARTSLSADDSLLVVVYLEQRQSAIQICMTGDLFTSATSKQVGEE